MDCSPPGSSIYGILQATILEWVAISSSRRSFWPRDQTQVSCIIGRLFTISKGGDLKLKVWGPLLLSTIYHKDILYMVATIEKSLLHKVKSERDKQTSYINTYIWNLEKWYWWTYFQGRTRDADGANRPVHTAEEGERRMNWESGIDVYALPCVKQLVGISYQVIF